MKVKGKNYVYDIDSMLPGDTLANDVEVGDLILFFPNKKKVVREYFEVCDIVKEFINDDVAKLYDDECLDSEILPEHTIIEFINESDEEMMMEDTICEVPGNAKLIVYRLANETIQST